MGERERSTSDTHANNKMAYKPFGSKACSCSLNNDAAKVTWAHTCSHGILLCHMRFSLTCSVNSIGQH